MMSKTMKTSTPSFAKGGSGKMSGKNSAGTQVSGQSAQLGRSSSKFAAGGKGKMFGKQSASPREPGKSGK